MISVPRSILLNESKKDSEVIIGLREGGVVTINTILPDERGKYEGIVNNSIDVMYMVKSKNWLVACHPNAMAFYSSQ